MHVRTDPTNLLKLR